MIGKQDRSQETLSMPGSLYLLIQSNRILKRLDKVLHLSWLRDEVRDCSDETHGRPSRQNRTRIPLGVSTLTYPRALLFLALFLLIGGASPRADATQSLMRMHAATGIRGPSRPDSLAVTAELDSTDLLLRLPEVVVRGDRITRDPGPGETHLTEQSIDTRGSRCVADLGPLLPSTRVSINSRGEALFMVRGAPERHLRVSFDGIPLAVPWDERADLSVIPADAVGAALATRGVRSVLDGPNAVAGAVRLVPIERSIEGWDTRLAFHLGESNLIEERFLYLHRRGRWNGVVALGHRRRDAFLVPADLKSPFNQGHHRNRTNSDLELGSLVLRLKRAMDNGGFLRVTVQGTDASKGVPPEIHTEHARFWRNPEQRRCLAGLCLGVPLGRDRLWGLTTLASIDFFRQEIRSYDDATYTTPELAPGMDLERDRDWTGYVETRLSRRLRSASSFTTMGVVRYARHQESLKVGGPETSFSQWLGSVVGEMTVRWGNGWELVSAGGYERASTPETGDKPSRGASDAAVAHLRLAKRWTNRAQLEASVSRRSRFPSLRELFSGALGRFVPNPDLGSERQDLMEIGTRFTAGRHSMTVTGFVAYLNDGIEKIVIPGEEPTLKRVNAGRIRTLGLEFTTAANITPGISLTAHHSFLRARRSEEHGFTAPAEDRPDYISCLSLAWEGVSGIGLLLESQITGPRHSIDVTDEVDGLRRLPSQGRWNVGASYRGSSRRAFPHDVGVFLRVDNLFDQQIDSQVGLPDAGRMVLAGIRVGWGSGPRPAGPPGRG